MAAPGESTVTLASAERAHSEHGASVCKRWWNCPGSVLLTRGMPNLQTPAALKGTAAHKLAELCLNSGQDAGEYVDRMLILDDCTTYPCDVAMAEAVQVYLDECRGPISEGEVTTLANLRAVQPENVMIEKRFNLAALNPPAPMFGTADFTAYVPVYRRLIVKDYKNGFGHVDERGPQMKYYALGAMIELGPDKPVSEIEVTIVQPNGRTGEPIRRATYEADDLAEWSIELMDRAAATLLPDAPIVAGEWCKFCPAAGTCAARAAANLAECELEFADLGPEPAAMPSVRLLTHAQIGDILRQANAVEAWISDVRAAASAAIARGEDIPGWIHVESSPREVWRFPEDAAIDLQLEYEFAEAEIYDKPKLRSFAQIRDLLAGRLYAAAKAARDADTAKPKVAPKLTKDAAQVAARAALRPLYYRPPGVPTLAPATSNRPAIQGGAPEFLALPDETE